MNLNIILNNLDKKVFDQPIHLVLMNQKYFNGIGNYLRAEILYRLPEVNPFMEAREILKRICPKVLDYVQPFLERLIH